MLAGVAIGAGTGAVAGHMAGEGARPLRRAGVDCELCSLVFAGGLALTDPTIGTTLFENGPFWIRDSRGLVLGAELEDGLGAAGNGNGPGEDLDAGPAADDSIAASCEPR